MMTQMVANSNPTKTNQLLLTEPLWNVIPTKLPLIVPFLVFGPTLKLLLLMVLLLLVKQNVVPVKQIMLEMLVNSTALLPNTKTVLMMINLPVNVTLIIGYGIMTVLTLAQMDSPQTLITKLVNVPIQKIFSAIVQTTPTLVPLAIKMQVAMMLLDLFNHSLFFL